MTLSFCLKSLFTIVENHKREKTLIHTKSFQHVYKNVNKVQLPSAAYKIDFIDVESDVHKYCLISAQLTANL